MTDEERQLRQLLQLSTRRRWFPTVALINEMLAWTDTGHTQQLLDTLVAAGKVHSSVNMDGHRYYRWGKEKRRGQGLVEYALIIALVALVVVAVLVLLGGQLSSIFTTISGNL